MSGKGNVVALKDVEAIASLPSKEELISKILFLINAQAQRLVTVLSAVPRNLAIVVKDAAGFGNDLAIQDYLS